MKKTSILACALLFVAVAAFAQVPPSQPSLTQEALAAILGLPAAGSCALQPSGVRQAAKRPAVLTGKSLCNATANCQYTTVSCSSNISASSCSATDAACPDQAGSVTCDGVTTSCPECCTGTLPRQIACCQCAQTGDCNECCRCGGGTFSSCAKACL